MPFVDYIEQVHDSGEETRVGSYRHVDFVRKQIRQIDQFITQTSLFPALKHSFQHLQ